MCGCAQVTDLHTGTWDLVPVVAVRHSGHERFVFHQHLETLFPGSKHARPGESYGIQLCTVLVTKTFLALALISHPPTKIWIHLRYITASMCFFVLETLIPATFVISFMEVVSPRFLHLVAFCWMTIRPWTMVRLKLLQRHNCNQQQTILLAINRMDHGKPINTNRFVQKSVG